MRIVARTIGAILLAAFSSVATISAFAQNYATNGSAGWAYIVHTSSGAGGYTVSASPTGGKVTANSSAGQGQGAATDIRVRFDVAVVQVAGNPGQQGFVQANCTATGGSGATNGGSAYAQSGYEYSPWLSLDWDISHANPYNMAWSKGWFADFAAATTISVVARAYTTANGGQGPGSGSSSADSTVSLVVK